MSTLNNLIAVSFKAKAALQRIEQEQTRQSQRNKAAWFASILEEFREVQHLPARHWLARYKDSKVERVLLEEHVQTLEQTELSFKGSEEEGLPGLVLSAAEESAQGDTCVNITLRGVHRLGSRKLALEVMATYLTRFILMLDEGAITPEAERRSDGELEREHGPDPTVERYYRFEGAKNPLVLTTEEREEFELAEDVRLEDDLIDSQEVCDKLLAFIKEKCQSDTHG